jgi:hypothetical protein
LAPQTSSDLPSLAPCGRSTFPSLITTHQPPPACHRYAEYRAADYGDENENGKSPHKDQGRKGSSSSGPLTAAEKFLLWKRKQEEQEVQEEQEEHEEQEVVGAGSEASNAGSSERGARADAALVRVTAHADQVRWY